MMLARITPLAAGLTALHLAAFQAPTPAPPSGLVLLDVVVERGNDPVSGLSRDDFELIHDSKPQRIEWFSAEDQPITVALLVDVTVSTRMNAGGGRLFGTLELGQLDKRMDVLLGAFIGLLAPGDRGLVGAIASRVVLGRRFTSDKNELAAAARETLALPGVDTFGPSPIWDAVDAVVTILAREPGRRALVVRTDGMATGNLLSVKDAARRAAAAGVSVNILAVGEDGGGRGASPRTALEWIAGETGGAFAVERGGNLKPQLIQMLNGLRYTYTLGFAGEQDGKPHSVEVRLRKSGLRLRFRKSYGG